MKQLIEFLTPWGWVEVYNDAPRIVQQHKRTKRYRSSMYDMAYGGTYWAMGNYWVEEV